jgi:cell division protein FtsB
MGRKTISQFEDELANERDDNARLYAKVENLRAEIADLEDDCDSESDLDEEEIETVDGAGDGDPRD